MSDYSIPEVTETWRNIRGLGSVVSAKLSKPLHAWLMANKDDESLWPEHKPDQFFMRMEKIEPELRLNLFRKLVISHYSLEHWKSNVIQAFYRYRHSEAKTMTVRIKKSVHCQLKAYATQEGFGSLSEAIDALLSNEQSRGS